MATSPRYFEQPPCYSLYAFVHLSPDQLPASGTPLEIKYIKQGEYKVDKVIRVTFAAILKEEQDKPLSKSGWGILGVEDNCTLSKCGELASELLKQSKCIVTVGEMQQWYSNIVITPLVSKRTGDYKEE